MDENPYQAWEFNVYRWIESAEDKVRDLESAFFKEMFELNTHNGLQPQ